MVVDHAIGPLLEVTSKLHGGRVPPLCAGLHDYFRDVYDHLQRLKQSTDLGHATGSLKTRLAGRPHGPEGGARNGTRN